MQDTTVLDKFLAQERTALNSYFGESDATVYAGLFGQEATYFDPYSSGKLTNEAIKPHFAGLAGQIPLWRYEILNPSVDVHGDTATFTFNLETYDPGEGSVTSRWNTTEVHHRSEGGWVIVHAHWSHTEPGG